MNGKQIVIIIALIVTIPTLLGLIIWTMNLSNDPNNPKHLEEGVKIIVEDVIPWWLGIIEWLSKLHGTIGIILLFGFVFFLKWVGEIN